jgi:hypothetical protein
MHEAQTGGVSTMTIDTWVSLAALLAVLLSLGGLILTQGRSLRSELKGDIARLDTKIDGFRSELKGDIAGLRTELKGDIAGLRAELKGDIARVRAELAVDIGRLDDRVYALAAGLRPQVEEAQSGQ